jgi:hypothetical protein
VEQRDRDFFRQHGYLDLGKVLSDAEVARFVEFYDRDRSECAYLWRPLGAHQTINCEALMSWREIDEIIRHFKIVAPMQELMGGPLTFEEVCVRHMGPYEGEVSRSFHRDRPHWDEHALRLDYIQAMVYLSDVNADTHCFSLSPESIDEEVLDKEQQIERGGIFDFHGAAGSVAIFNISVLHTATVRPTQQERKTIQTYYGHPERSFLSNDSTIPARLWRDAEDEVVRAFYGKLNPKSELFARAF